MKKVLGTIINYSFLFIVILIACKTDKKQEICFEISKVQGEGYFFSSPDDKMNLEKISNKFSSEILNAEFKKTNQSTFEIEIKNKSNDTILAVSKPFGVRSIEDKTKVVLHFFPVIDNENGIFEIEFAENSLKINPNTTKSIKFNGYDIKTNVLGFSYQIMRNGVIPKIEKEKWLLLRNQKK